MRRCGHAGRSPLSLVALGVLALAPSAHAHLRAGRPAGLGRTSCRWTTPPTNRRTPRPPTPTSRRTGAMSSSRRKATNFFENDGETQQEKEAAEPPGTRARRGHLPLRPRNRWRSNWSPSGNLVVNEGNEAGKVLVRGAENPSVSAEGRYVVFSTAQQLVPSSQPEHTENVEVYERDMGLAPAQARGVHACFGAERQRSSRRVFDDSSHQPRQSPAAIRVPSCGQHGDQRQWALRLVSHRRSAVEPARRLTPTTPPGQLFVRDLLDEDDHARHAHDEHRTSRRRGRRTGDAQCGRVDGRVGRRGRAVADSFLPGEDLTNRSPTTYGGAGRNQIHPRGV